MTEISKESSPQTIFERIGGEAKVRELVDRFYDLMDAEELPRGIRALHPADLSESRNKLFWFLVGWMGGPPLFVHRFGHPRLRARHLPFAIGERERDEWLWCMFHALDDVVPDVELRTALAQSLMQLADFMRNQSE